MKRFTALTITTLALLTACASTTATPPTTTVVTTTLAPTTTAAPATTLPPTTVAPVTTKAPSTTKPKTTPTTYPQLQLTGTPEEQLTQVVVATTKVAASAGNFKTWSSKLYQLNQSVSSYGIKIVWDPNDVGKDIYQVSMNGQSACFLWTYKDASVSTDKYLQPHSC